MAKGDRYSFYRFSGSQGRWMQIIMESLGVRGDDGIEAAVVVGATWVDQPAADPSPPAVGAIGAPGRPDRSLLCAPGRPDRSLLCAPSGRPDADP